MTVFGGEYASLYDALYFDKDYSAECDLLEAQFGLLNRPVRRVLDLGCGTGRHAVELAARGYEVVGVDLSLPMLERARSRAAAAGLEPRRIEFLHGDIRTVDAPGTFDAAIAMFAVLGYLRTDADLSAALSNASRHVALDGLVAFDVWYGPAVLSERPSSRSRLIETGEGMVERRATASLNRQDHTCAVTYELIAQAGEGSRAVIGREVHEMRYYFNEDIQRAMATAGLDLQMISAWPDVERPASAASWNAFVTARRSSP